MHIALTGPRPFAIDLGGGRIYNVKNGVRVWAA